MHVAVTGAAGMIGRKLTDRLVADGYLGGAGLDRLSLFDVVEPATPEGWTGVLDRAVLDLAGPGAGDAVVARRPEVILHLAAVVSGEAEADFDKGYRVNLDDTRHLLEAIRRTHLADGYLPRLVFTSSIAVYGAPLPDPIPDEFPATPRTSYGTQKAIDELLLADFTRRGFVDGVGIRLPGVTATVGEQIEALRRVAGDSAVALIRREPDETIMRMVSGWAPCLAATRARALGFTAETSFDEIIRVHLEDELGH